VDTVNQSVVSLGGRGQASNFGIASIDYSNLYGTERTIDFSDGPNHGAKVNLVSLPSDSVEQPTVYLGTQADRFVDGQTYEISDTSRLTQRVLNGAPLVTDANPELYIVAGSNLTDASQVVEGAQFTWNGHTYWLVDPLGVKEVKDSMSSIIENVQLKINTARVQAGSQYAAIESAVNYSTDLTVQYELGKNVVSDLNFSSEAAHLAKAQILQNAASAMLIQANRGQRGLISLIS
jgi:flagellin-like hook-associated protein FlgL